MSPRRELGALFLLGATVLPGKEDLARVRDVLRRDDSAESAPQILVQKLVALGPDAVDELYALATGKANDALIGEEWVPAQWLCLPEEIAPLCAAALERAPDEPLFACFTQALDDGPTFQEHLVQARLLGARGSAGGLALLMRNATMIGELDFERPSVRKTLRGALGAILRRDERAWSALDPVLDSGAALSRVVVEAIGESASVRGMAVLERLFARGSLPREDMARAMAALEAARPFDLGGRTMNACRVYWRSPDAAERALVAVLASRVHALERIPELIEFLGDGEAVVSRSAAQTLAALAGCAVASSGEGWTQWHELEQAWFQERFGACSAQLIAARAGDATEVLAEFAAHPLYRHAAARVLAESLPRMKRAPALAACRELERIASPGSIPGLVAVLVSGPPAIQNAVAATLRTLVGDSAHDLAHWRAWVGA